MTQGIFPVPSLDHFEIKELEVSITSKCNLLCDHCGFNIPEQPQPYIENPIEEIEQSLKVLKKLNFSISSIAVMGGEATLSPRILEEALIMISEIGVCGRIELVTNGLVPKGISEKSVQLINRFSISNYIHDEEWESLWSSYVSSISPNTEIIFRNHSEGWDQWWGNETVSDEVAQEMFNNCWYRKHCVTIERSRLFICSRIPKIPSDEEGLLLSNSTRQQDVVNYLSRATYLPSCKSCIPMMNLPKVKPGVQPDNRLEIQLKKSVQFLKSKLTK